MNLALQGGGAHGAFTWGVLDRLLDHGQIDFGRISATGLGAFNAAALATGLAQGGRRGAKRNLELLWLNASEAPDLLAALTVPVVKAYTGFGEVAKPLYSPYQSDSFGLEPLRRLARGTIDVTLLRQSAAPMVFVYAISAQSGHCRVFGPRDMTDDALLASACAPLVFQAVKIADESYWEGSFGGNPMLWPLFKGQLDADIMLVEVMPPMRKDTATTAKNIFHRLGEISATNAMVNELRAIEAFNARSPYMSVRMHAVSLLDGVDSSAMPMPAPPHSKIDLAWLHSLRDYGYAAADRWLQAHEAQLGVACSVDIAERYVRAHAHEDVLPKGLFAVA